MKRTILLLTAASLAFTACKKSNNPGEDDIYELPYNKEGIAANKAFIENEGRAFVAKINDLPQNPAINALESLADLEFPELDLTVDALVKVGRSKEKLASINGALTKLASAPTEKELYKLSQAFGIYTYNSKTQGWDKSAATDRLELKFPSTKGGTTNNAILTLNYKSSGKSMTVTDEYRDWIYNPGTGEYESKITTVDKTYELPSEIVAKMTIAGTAVMNLTSSYSYHNDNFPKSAVVDFNFGAYSAKAEAKNDNNAVGVSFSFAKDAEVLITASGNANFDALSYDKIVNAEDTDDLADIFLGANAKLGVGSLALAGHVDYKTINNLLKPFDDTEPIGPDWSDYFENIQYPNYDDYKNQADFEKAKEEYRAKIEAAEKKYNADWKKYEADFDLWDKKYYTVLANALNKNAALILANTNSKQKIASITFEMDEIKEEWNNETYVYYELKPFIVFGDESKVDFDAFGETGFQNLIKDIKDLINKFDR